MSGGLSNEAEDLEFLRVFQNEMSWVQVWPLVGSCRGYEELCLVDKGP